MGEIKNQRVKDLEEIIDIFYCSPVRSQIYIFGAIWSFIKQEYEQNTLDKREYKKLRDILAPRLMGKREDIIFFIRALDINKLSDYQRDMLSLGTNAAELEIEISATDDFQQKNILKEELRYLLYQVYSRTAAKKFKYVVYDFFLNWGDRIYFE